LRYAVLALLILTVPAKASEDYLVFLSEAKRFCRIWNSEMHDTEITVWASTSWRSLGSEGSYYFAAVCAQESGFKYITNESGCGYAGTKWYTIIAAAQYKGAVRPHLGWRRFFVKNKGRANLRSAEWFSKIRSESPGWEDTIKTWHRGKERNEKEEKEANKYYRKVMKCLKRINSHDRSKENNEQDAAKRRVALCTRGY
jgi:hypothetical protein